MPKYQLIFKGQLLANVDQEHCIEQLSKLFKNNHNAVKNKLFTGKPVLIKTTHNVGQVEAFIKAFKKAGAVLIVKEIREENNNAIEPSSSMDSSTEIATTESQYTSAESSETETSIEPPEIETSTESPETETSIESLAIESQAEHKLEDETFHEPEDRLAISRDKRTINPFALFLTYKKQLITATVVLGSIAVVMAIGSYLWLQHKLSTVNIPHSVLITENALATENLIAAAYMNASKVIELEEFFLGKVDENQAKSPDPDVQQGLLDKLLTANISLRDSIQQILFTLHLDDESSTYYTTVLQGRFNPEQIKHFILQEYQIDPSTENKTIIQFRYQDAYSCELSPLLAIAISPEQIIITEAQAMNALLERINNQAAAEKDLTNWQSYRQDMLATMAVFAPQYTDKDAKGLAGMMLQGLTEKIKPVQSVFSGVSTSILPSGLQWDLTLNSNDEQWISNTNEQLQTLLDNTREKLPDDAPSAQNIFDHLQLASTNKQLKAQLLINDELLQNFSDTIGEVMSSIFSSGNKTLTPNDNVKEEKLAQSPLQYVSQFNPEQLVSFSAIKDQGFKADWTQGPFGLFIDNIAINPDNEIQITVKAEGRQLTTLGKSTKRASLRINSLKDQSGNELLKKENCGSKQNTSPVFFDNAMTSSYYLDGEMHSYLKTGTQKTIRTKAGTKINQITELNGKITLQLPTKTERILLKAPFDNQQFKKHGLKLKFTQGQEDQLHYDLSGETKNLLAVRGLNSNEQVLAQSSRSSMDRFMGNGQSIQQDFYGKVVYAEITVATESQTIEYPFRLSSVQPKQPATSFPRQQEPLSTLSLEDFTKDFSKLPPMQIKEQDSWLGTPDHEQAIGPFFWQIYAIKINQYWGTSANIKLYSPTIPAFINNLSACQIQFDEAQFSDGEAVPFSFYDFIPLKRVGGYFSNGIYQADPEKNYLAGQFNLKMDYKGERPSQIKGRLILNFPLQLDTIDIPSLNLGEEIHHDDYLLKITGIGRSYLKMDITGKRQQVLSLDVLDENNVSISSDQGNLEKSNPQQNRWTAVLRFNGEPAKITMNIATEGEKTDYPFVIKLGGAANPTP